MMDNNSNRYVTIELPVQWGDMDAAQHVNNTVFLRWIESARIQMFRKMQEGKLDFGKVIPILAWQDCKYIFPVTFPDQVVITMDVIELIEDRILCEGKIHSKKHQRIVAISKTLLVAFDREESKKQQLPQKWKKSFTDFYGGSILK